MRRPRTPDSYVPGAEELLALCRRYPAGATLRTLVEAGALHNGRRDRAEVDLLASLVFYPAPAAQQRAAP